MSILGLDVGEKRIGMALGTMLAEEYDTISIQQPQKTFLDKDQGTKQAIDNILKVIREEHIEKIVIGLPVRADNTLSSIAEEIKKFGDHLGTIADIPIEFTNETLTSFTAEQILRDEGATIDEAKKRVDQVSAKLILQQYLEDHT